MGRNLLINEHGNIWAGSKYLGVYVYEATFASALADALVRGRYYFKVEPVDAFGPRSSGWKFNDIAREAQSIIEAILR